MTVTSTPKTKLKRFMGPPNFFIGEENESATSLVGLISRSTNLNINPTHDDVALQTIDKLGDVAIDVARVALELSLDLVQIGPTLLAISQGVTENGQITTVGGSPTIRRQHSAKVTADTADGTGYELIIPSCIITPNGARVMGPGEHMLIPIILKAQDHPDNSFMYTETTGDGNVIATISTGALTRVLQTPETFHRVAAESGTADVLDSITAGDLVDNEILTLQAAAGDTITVTNTPTGTNTIDLEGTDDVILTGSDILKVQYDLAGTEWNEIFRQITQ